MATKSNKKVSKSKKPPPTPNDEEVKRTQLIEKAKTLKDEIEKERQTKIEFETKIKQLQFYWDLEKEELRKKKIEYENLEEKEAMMRREHESRVDIRKEQIKLLLHRNQNDLIKAKTESKVEFYKLQEEHLIELRKKEFGTMECHKYLRHMQNSQNNFLNQLRHDRDYDLKQIHEDFKIRFDEITIDADRKVRELKEEVEANMKDEFKVLEEEKEQQVKDLLYKHDEELTKLRNKYNKKIHDELDTIKDLKEKLESKRYKLRQSEKKLNEVRTKNKSIVGPLKEVQIEMENLNRELEQVKSEKQVYNQRKLELKIAEDKLKDAQWRHEVLFQRYELLESEKDKYGKEFSSLLLRKKQMKNLHSLMIQKLQKEYYDVLKEKYDLIVSNNPQLNVTENNNDIMLETQRMLLDKLQTTMDIVMSQNQKITRSNSSSEKETKNVDEKMAPNYSEIASSIVIKSIETT